MSCCRYFVIFIALIFKSSVALAGCIDDHVGYYGENRARALCSLSNNTISCIDTHIAYHGWEAASRSWWECKHPHIVRSYFPSEAREKKFWLYNPGVIYLRPKTWGVIGPPVDTNIPTLTDDSSS